MSNIENELMVSKQSEKQRVEETDKLKNQVIDIQKKQADLLDDCQDLRKILGRIDMKFDNMYKEFKDLVAIQIKDKEEISDKFSDVSKRLFEQMTKARSMCEISDNNVQSLKLVTELATNKMEECNRYIKGLEANLNQYKNQITAIESLKAEKEDVEAQYKIFEEAIETLDKSDGIFDNRIKFVENFIDKYIPIQVQALISDSIYSITQNEGQNKRYQKHLNTMMERFHEKILNDEGVSNIEISMDLLGGQAAQAVRKSKRKVNYQKMMSAQVPENKHMTLSSAKSSVQNGTIESAKNVSSLDPDMIIMEKSEVDSNLPSSMQGTPKKHPSDLVDNEYKVAVSEAEGSEAKEKHGNKETNKPFIKLATQRNTTRNEVPSALKSFEQSHGGHIGQELHELEDMVYDLQNSFSTFETKMKDTVNQ